MATKLSDLIKMIPRSSQLDVPCGLGCGRVTKEFMFVSVKGATVQMENKGSRNEEIAPTPALELRICHPCMGQFIYDATEGYRDLKQTAEKNGR